MMKLTVRKPQISFRKKLASTVGFLHTEKHFDKKQLLLFHKFFFQTFFF